MPACKKRSLRAVVLWKVAVYGWITAALTLAFWIDPLHDETRKYALILGPISGLLVTVIVEGGPKVLALIFGRDVLGGNWR